MELVENINKGDYGNEGARHAAEALLERFDAAMPSGAREYAVLAQAEARAQAACTRFLMSETGAGLRAVEREGRRLLREWERRRDACLGILRDFWHDKGDGAPGGGRKAVDKARVAAWRLDVDYCCLLHSTTVQPGKPHLDVDVDELKFLVRRLARRYRTPSLNLRLPELMDRHRQSWDHAYKAQRLREIRLGIPLGGNGDDVDSDDSDGNDGNDDDDDDDDGTDGSRFMLRPYSMAEASKGTSIREVAQ